MEIKYRPEVDGLRTVAVVSVIIYHAEFLMNGAKILPGGFFGVDVFFVISGFLITSLMMSEFHKSGTISIRNFYLRRARRLLPALLLVMLLSLPFAWLYLLPSQLVNYAESLVATLLFGSNFLWHFSLQEYGAESGLLKPFLHTWSLAVEEQYYIVFPLILLAIYKWYKSNTIALLTAGLLASLFFAEWMTSVNPSFSFYMLPSRFWELLVGALLANILHLHPQKDNDALLNKTMPTVGLFLIMYSLIFIGFDSGHPGFVTLIPVIGTMLIIWFASEGELVTKTLSSKSFVYIGLISYALYLWHYPIFAFFRLEGLFDSNIGRIVAIIMTFILSAASVKFIEKPLRSKNTLSNAKFFLLIGSVSAFVFVFSFAVIQNKGFENRFESFSGFLNYEADNRKLKEESWSLLSEVDGKPFDSSKVNVLLVGNSHSKDLFNAFYLNPDLYADYDFRRANIGSNKLAQVSCFDKNNPDFAEAANEFFSSEQYVQSQVIVVSSFYRLYQRKCFKEQRGDVTKSYDLDGLRHLIERAQHDGKGVVVFGQNVMFPINDNITDVMADEIIGEKKKQGQLGFITENEKLFTELRSEVNGQYFEGLDRSEKLNKRIREITDNYGVSYFDNYHVVCEEKDSECFGLTPDGYKSYFDSSHFTLEAAKFFGARMAQEGVLKLFEKQTSKE
ncbi:O-acetyltransferase OatA [Halioglobus japonicus]|nr:O-acetyltransferase OatA [Halioglobus japonicus]